MFQQYGESMFRKKDPGNSPKVEQSVAKAVSYEITVADMARRSERRWSRRLIADVARTGGRLLLCCR